MKHPRHNEDQDEPGFLRRHRFVVTGVAVLAAAGVLYGLSRVTLPPAPKKQEKIFTVVTLPPPPPPPPPPPVTPPPPPKEEEMVEQTPVEEPEEKPEEAPAPESPPDIGTSLTGGGPGDGFGLSSGGGKGTGGTGIGGNHAPRSKYGWYAGQVQVQIQEALRGHEKTKTAEFGGDMRIWLDAAGRIVRVKLAGTTGRAETDRLIETEVLGGRVLKDPPPADMPMPIVLRVTMRRPG